MKGLFTEKESSAENVSVSCCGYISSATAQLHKHSIATAQLQHCYISTAQLVLFSREQILDFMLDYGCITCRTWKFLYQQAYPFGFKQPFEIKVENLLKACSRFAFAVRLNFTLIGLSSNSPGHLRSLHYVMEFTISAPFTMSLSLLFTQMMASHITSELLSFVEEIGLASMKCMAISRKIGRNLSCATTITFSYYLYIYIYVNLMRFTVNSGPSTRPS